MVTSIDNIVKISRNNRDPKEVASYLQAVIIRFSPEVYNRYYCVKIRFHKKALGYVDYIINKLYNLGVRFKEVHSITDGIDTGRGIILDNCYELTLVKLRILEEESEQEAREEAEKVSKALNEIRNTWVEPKD